jgi:hypothetical protein
MTARDVVGRKAELDAIDAFLDRLAHGPAAVAFEGHPGIGKTTVWWQVFERAAARSCAVLSCRPVQAEAKLAFASLADLFEPAADEILPQLPEPQRLALAVALMRASPHGALASARAVATAVGSAMRLLAAAAAEDAVARWLQAEMRIEVGRALVTLGQVRRRRGERRAAREALERAHLLFRDLGAPLWAERTTAEVGLTSHSSWPSTRP